MNSNKILNISKEEVNEFFSGRWSEFYSRYVETTSTAGKWSKSRCPFHSDSDPSLSFHSETGQFKCFGCDAKGDAFKFYGLLKGLSAFPEILQGIASEFGINGAGPAKKRIVATYDYTDKSGNLLYQVVRMQPKDFRQRRPDGQGGWIWNMEGVQKVLYGLPEVLSAETVVLLEGEKDVDRLRSLGFTSTTNAGGAGKWLPEYTETLKGKDVVIIPDNDEAGRSHAQKVARSLDGIASAIKVVELPGLPEKGDVSDFLDSGGTAEELQQLIDGAPEWSQESDSVEEEEESQASILFPRKPFPWWVLPPAVSESFKQLARSHATSPTSLPGAAACVIASLIGDRVSVSPKRSWKEPLIFWNGDARNSGTGKTHQARALCDVLYRAQTTADERYQREMEEWKCLPKKERGNPPPRPRGYFITNLTLEGLRSNHSGHGGTVCVLDELSSFVSSQNEYKSKGSDRESWLCLHDGKPARIVRSGESLTIKGSRVQVFGGIQHKVMAMAFSGDNAILSVDGTLYRFQITYEGDAFHPLTNESWSEEDQATWEDLLLRAMRWADAMLEENKTLSLVLTEEARDYFIDWRNSLTQLRAELPELVQPFIPKLIGYALRWSGVLYLMKAFSEDQDPYPLLKIDDVQKGVTVSEFYLGHHIVAMKALSGSPPVVVEEDGQTIRLVQILKSLEGDVDNRLLAVGFIQEKFNENCESAIQVKSPRLMGSLLRRCGLTVAGGKRANGRVNVFCLVWDKKTIRFIETPPQSPHSPQSQDWRGSPAVDKSSPMSTKSTGNEDVDESLWRSWTSGGQVHNVESLAGKGFVEEVEEVDKFSKEEEKNEDWEVLII